LIRVELRRRLSAESPQQRSTSDDNASLASGTGRAIIEFMERGLSKNIHSAGAGTAWPEAACFFFPKSQVCNRSR
jgi:hypothetical protein